MNKLLAKVETFTTFNETVTFCQQKYYEMDCADMIGEDKIKFKYRQVEPQTYGLTPNEILNSDNKALNSWVSIKKVVG